MNAAPFGTARTPVNRDRFPQKGHGVLRSPVVMMPHFCRIFEPKPPLFASFGRNQAKTIRPVPQEGPENRTSVSRLFALRSRFLGRSCRCGSGNLLGLRLAELDAHLVAVAVDEHRGALREGATEHLVG